MVIEDNVSEAISIELMTDEKLSRLLERWCRSGIKR